MDKWLEIASENDNFTNSPLSQNLEVKVVIDKLLYKNTFKSMKMHSYCVNEQNFLTDVKRIFGHCTNNRLVMINSIT